MFQQIDTFYIKERKSKRITNFLAIERKKDKVKERKDREKKKENKYLFV